MTTNKNALDQLKSFLNKLFQFESQDLDFSIYKILHYKSEEIKRFINELLVDRVKEQLQTLTAAQIANAQKELSMLSESTGIRRWIEAKAKNETKRLEIYEEDYKNEIKKYRDLEAQINNAQVSTHTEEIIYNHLTLFFSRYYDKGDFIGKRRFGKNEKYVVPYNGEETHFYWATQDQYYIKSSENFQRYAFKVPHMHGTLTVNFKLTEAQTEQGNVKADENNYFVLSEKEPELQGDELNIFFEYRPLTKIEKKDVGTQNKQEKLNEKAAKILQKKLTKEIITANLWKEDNEQTLLLKKLHHYTRKNSYDFFIHKNLKGFLQRELDYYVKSELINVDDLYVLETDMHFERIRHNFKTIKVFKNIADIIIDFLAQIEDFQKKLWEKKKFVLSTEWVITIDKLVEWLGEEDAKPFLEETLKNQTQINEWVELFGKDNLPHPLFKKGQKEIKILKQDSLTWKKLPIDTVHSNSEFKWQLLNALSQKIDLEDKTDGLLINSDNFHGLTLFGEKFKEKMKCIYIDPPFNSKSSEIIYKNAFKHSSWISLVENRIYLTKTFLTNDGVHIIAIDENEQENLGLLIKRAYGDHKSTAVSIVINPGGTQDDNFAYTHEFAYFIYKNTGKQIALQDRTDNPDIRNFMNTAKGDTSNYLRSSGANCFYPIYVKDGKIHSIGSVCDENFHPAASNIQEKEGIVAVYPIDNDGVERKWVFARQSVDLIQNDLRPKYNKEKGLWEIERVKSELNYKTVWDSKNYSAKKYGTSILKDIIGKGKTNFSFPKSIWTTKDCLHGGLNNTKKTYILDYFAGSGTTFHSVLLLNEQYNMSNKCLLIEQGQYTYSVIIPRIKKIAYTFEWKDGQPKNGSMNGLGVFFKYQRLEQYEEALENIAFSVSDEMQQQALKFDQYIPKYFLEFETRDSQTLVNTEAMQNPWDYKLKVWDGYTYDTKQAVDLVETFNYLIGLHLQKYITKKIEGKRYQFIYGHNNSNKQILVVWRNVKDWNLEDYETDAKSLNEELKKFKYDLLYINNQAHLENYLPIEDVFKNKMIS